MSTRNAKSILALAAIAAAPIVPAPIDLNNFNPRFDDNGGGATAGATATATPAQQPAANADPVTSLREEFNRVRTEALTLTQTAQAAGRQLTDAEAQANEARFRRLDVIESTMREFSRFAARALPAATEGQSAAAAGSAVTTTAQPNPPGREQFERGQQAAPTGSLPGQRAGESREQYDGRVQAAVNHYIRTGVDQTSQFVITRGTDSGALVPTRLVTPVVIKRISNPFRAALAARGLRTLSSSSTETIRIPFLDDTSNVADQIAETATGDNPKDPSVTGLNLGAKLYDSGTVWFSNSLRLAMDFDLYSYVEPRLDERIEQKQTAEWTTATIAGTVGKTTASTTGITYTELLQWQHSMPVIRRPTGVFIISDGLQLALRGLTDGNGRLIYQESARDDAPDRLLGWPVFISAELAAPGAAAVSGIAIAADGLHIREVTPTRVVRYVDQPAWPDQFGVRKFANGDFAFEPTAVRLLKHAAA